MTQRRSRGFLDSYGNFSTKKAYAFTLVLYLRWLRQEKGVDLSNFNPMNHKEISRNVRRYIAWRNRHTTNTTPPARRTRKISGDDEPHYAGNVG